MYTRAHTRAGTIGSPSVNPPRRRVHTTPGTFGRRGHTYCMHLVADLAQRTAASGQSSPCAHGGCGTRVKAKSDECNVPLHKDNPSLGVAQARAYCTPVRHSGTAMVIWVAYDPTCSTQPTLICYMSGSRPCKPRRGEPALKAERRGAFDGQGDGDDTGCAERNPAHRRQLDVCRVTHVREVHVPTWVLGVSNSAWSDEAHLPTAPPFSVISHPSGTVLTHRLPTHF